MGKSKTWIKIITLFSFIIMICVNTYANVFMINGKTVNQISDSYPNLYAPHPYTYFIWLLIYLLLAMFVIYQLGLFGQAKLRIGTQALNKVRILFVLAVLLSASFVFAYHYDYLALALMIMILVSICAVSAFHIISLEELSAEDKLLIRLPFSIFSAWNIMSASFIFITLMVSIGWQGYQTAEQIFTIIFLVVITGVNLAIIKRYKDIAFALTIIWAYLGILVKHLAPDGFHGQYPGLIFVLLCALVLFAASVIILQYNKIKK